MSEHPSSQIVVPFTRCLNINEQRAQLMVINLAPIYTSESSVADMPEHLVIIQVFGDELGPGLSLGTHLALMLNTFSRVLNLVWEYEY